MYWVLKGHSKLFQVVEFVDWQTFSFQENVRPSKLARSQSKRPRVYAGWLHAAHVTLLIASCCRCRHSDTLAVEDVLHNHSEGAGYVQLRTKYHKGSKSAAKKSLLLPIVGSSAGVGSPSWVQSWWETRKMANLPVEGQLGAPLMPAPAPQCGVHGL